MAETIRLKCNKKQSAVASGKKNILKIVLRQGVFFTVEITGPSICHQPIEIRRRRARTFKLAGKYGLDYPIEVQQKRMRSCIWEKRYFKNSVDTGGILKRCNRRTFKQAADHRN